MATVTSPESPTSTPLGPAPPRAQGCVFLLEMSPDWLILRASENVHGFLGEYPARLTGEPLSSFTLAQPLHDLRNSLARQRSSSGIGRAYQISLTHGSKSFDIAFQQRDGRIILEALPSSGAGFGDSLGAVSRLIDGISAESRGSLIEDATRRMRALTGFDRVTLTMSSELGEQRSESARSPFAAPASAAVLPGMVADSKAATIGLYPAPGAGSVVGTPLLRGLTDAEAEELRANEVRGVLSVPVARRGQVLGWFRCERRTAWTPSIELHAAAELFAQIVAFEMDRLPD